MERLLRMDAEQFIARMESMWGVTTDRIKGRGRRWDIDNAEAVMALEVLRQSNLWDKYGDKAFCNRN